MRSQISATRRMRCAAGGRRASMTDMVILKPDILELAACARESALGRRQHRWRAFFLDEENEKLRRPRGTGIF